MRTKKVNWADSADAHAKYIAARAAAQAEANADGFDRGLERNDLFKSFSYRMLPAKQFRCGHELRCEVVSCEILSKCQEGHGPR